MDTEKHKVRLNEAYTVLSLKLQHNCINGSYICVQNIKYVEIKWICMYNEQM